MLNVLKNRATGAAAAIAATVALTGAAAVGAVAPANALTAAGSPAQT